jgi:hypothetical protein
VKPGDRIKLTENGAASLDKHCMRPRSKFSWRGRRGVIVGIPKNHSGVRILWDGRRTSDSICLPWHYIEPE